MREVPDRKGTPTHAQGEVLAVVVGRELGPDVVVAVLRDRVHVRNEAKPPLVLQAWGRGQLGVDEALVTQRHIVDAQLLEFCHQQSCKIKLLFGGGGRGALAVTGGTHYSVFKQSLVCLHGQSPYVRTWVVAVALGCGQHCAPAGTGECAGHMVAQATGGGGRGARDGGT